MKKERDVCASPTEREPRTAIFLFLRMSPGMFVGLPVDCSAGGTARCNDLHSARIYRIMYRDPRDQTRPKDEP